MGGTSYLLATLFLRFVKKRALLARSPRLAALLASVVGGDGEPCPRSVAPPIDVGFCLERRRSLRWRPMLSSRPDSGRVSAPLLYVGRVFPAMTGRALRAERAPDEQKRATDCSLVTFVAGRGYLLRRACRIDGLRKARLPSFALP